MIRTGALIAAVLAAMAQTLPPTPSVAAIEVRDLTSGFWAYRGSRDPQAWSELYVRPNRAVFSSLPCEPLRADAPPPGWVAGWDRLEPRMRAFSSDVATALPEASARFVARFPDMAWRGTVYVLVSAGCFDGRAQRVAGRDSLLFGIDMIAWSGNDNLVALVHHELFHAYHAQHFRTRSTALWVSLWKEGLATYAARSLNPEATLAELLLPPELVRAVEADRPRLLAELLRVYDRGDDRARTLFFRTDPRPEPIPPRAGYYIGLLAVERLAADGHSLEDMVRWSPETVEPRLRQAVARLG